MTLEQAQRFHNAIESSRHPAIGDFNSAIQNWSAERGQTRRQSGAAGPLPRLRLGVD